jgi:hypothetical protein
MFKSLIYIFIYNYINIINTQILLSNFLIFIQYKFI